MLTLKFRVKDNWRTMIQIEDELKRQVGEGVKATAEAIVADIRSSWSGMAPSEVGSPPAVRSGVLDKSVVVDEQSGRDLSGRFTGPNAVAYYVKADTAENDPRGYNYAMALEDPDYLDRPFLSSALERAEDYYAANIKRFVRL
jgi:hypothetical protein